MTEYLIHRNDDTELAHFGTKGMKWGVRRYQNEDGSYKSGAEGRYADDGKPGVNTKGSSSGSVDKKAAKLAKQREAEEFWAKNNDKLPKRWIKTKAEKEAEKKVKEKEKAEKKTAKEEEKKRKQEEKTKYWQEQIKLAEKEEAERKAKKAADKQAKAEAKAAKKAEKEAKQKAQYEEAQRKADEKASKDSYKKIAGRYILRDLAGTAASYGTYKLTGSTDLARTVAYGSSGYNFGKTVADAYNLHSYRKRNKAKHSDYSEYELYHHGILGMHWGIRRYQNEDGTLTAAGKRRYRTDDDMNDKGETRKSVRDRLNKSADKNDKLAETYYNKSEYKQKKDKFDNSILDRALWSTKYDENEGWSFDSDRGWEEKINYEKRVGTYNESKDKNLNRSKSHTSKANEAREEAKALGKHYVAGSTFAQSVVGAMSGAALGTIYGAATGKTGKDFTKALLVSSLAGASLAGITGYSSGKKTQERVEKKYGFKK